MPGRQWSDQVNLNNSQKTTELLPPKHRKIMAFPPTATFSQLFPFQNELWGQTFNFLIDGNRGRMANSTAKRENWNKNESDGLVR